MAYFRLSSSSTGPEISSVFIFPPKLKDVLTISLEPKITCVVVDISQDDPAIQFSWFVDGKEVHDAQKQDREPQFNSTFREVSVLPILHQDWLNGKEFKCRVNREDFPAPIEKTISKTMGEYCKVDNVVAAIHEHFYPVSDLCADYLFSVPTGQLRVPQVYTMPPPKEQLTKSEVSLTCMITGFYPEDIDVEWKRNGQPENNYKNTPPVLDTNESFFLYSKFNVKKSDWETGDIFVCSVVHEALHNHHTEKNLSYTPGK